MSGDEKLYTQDEVLADLANLIRRAGGVRPWCRQVRIKSHPPISQALTRRRPVTPDIALKVGYIAVTRYMKVGE